MRISYEKGIKERINQIFWKPCVVKFETYSRGAEGAWSSRFPSKRKAIKAIKRFFGNGKMIPIDLDKDGEWFYGSKLRSGYVRLYAGIFSDTKRENK